MKTAQVTTEDIWKILNTIPDPEIPVINIVELGIARKVTVAGDHAVVTITPTYTGCPAMKAIEQDIVSAFAEHGWNVEIKMEFAPVWTTDWISEEAKEKLHAYGIAPPQPQKQKKIRCIRCNSSNTEMISQFSSTACKALYRCKDCREPFEYFKCH